MIHRYVFHNDCVVPVEETRLSPGQSGLLCGWGLFTTLRVFEGVPFAFERHWHRLERDAELTLCPFPFKMEDVRRYLQEVLRSNQVREGCARIYVVNNQPGHWRSDEAFPKADLMICSADLPNYRDRVRLTTRAHGRHAASPLANAKVTSWLNNVWSLQEAQREGFDEVILLNERGEVAECTAANIFCVQRGTVVTPPLSSGCLPGITREVVLEIGAPAGIPVVERTLFPKDLTSADEVFISSTNRNVLPVTAIDGQDLPSDRGQVTQKLERILAKYIRAYVESRMTMAG
jgi:branched-chain amino acid aminotransferase